MIITKLVHSCFIADTGRGRVLFDPGSYLTAPEQIRDIDIVVISHEHHDHFWLPNLRVILENNPRAAILTNGSIHKLLSAEGIPSHVLVPGEPLTIHGITLEAVGKLHAVHHPFFPPVENIGVILENHLYYPGDSFTKPGRPIAILALPVAGGWQKISESIDFALDLKPREVFPVHEANMKSPRNAHKLPKNVLESAGISFRVIPEGGSAQLSDVAKMNEGRKMIL